MGLESYIRFLKKTPEAVLWLSAGVILTLTLGQYQGIVELHLGESESYLKVDGKSRCELVGQ